MGAAKTIEECETRAKSLFVKSINIMNALLWDALAACTIRTLKTYAGRFEQFAEVERYLATSEKETFPDLIPTSMFEANTSVDLGFLADSTTNDLDGPSDGDAVDDPVGEVPEFEGREAACDSHMFPDDVEEESNDLGKELIRMGADPDLPQVPDPAWLWHDDDEGNPVKAVPRNRSPSPKKAGSHMRLEPADKEMAKVASRPRAYHPQVNRPQFHRSDQLRSFSQNRLVPPEATFLMIHTT